MSFNRIRLIILITFILTLCSAGIFLEANDLKNQKIELARHAQIIKNDLWNYNYKSPAEYLKLAARLQNYEHITVFAINDEVFLEIDGPKVSEFSRFLTRIGLIPEEKFEADIFRHGEVIGKIEVIDRHDVILTLAYLFIVLSLIFLVLLFFIQISNAKRTLKAQARELEMHRDQLEELVEKRTNELSQTNNKLKRENIERIQVEKELRESEDKFRSFAEQSLVGIYLISGSVFTYVNPKFAEIFGYSVDECLNNMYFRQLVHPEDLATIEKQVGRRLSGETKAVQYSFRGIKKSGETIHVEIFGSSMLLKGKSVVTGTMLDITDRKQAEEKRKQLQTQLQQAQKMEAIGTLAGGVAHDLNNILGGLVSYPELLLLQLPEDSPLRKSILTIQKSGEKAAAVVQDLLTLARRGVVVTEVVNLNDIIAQYLESPEHERLQSYHPGVHSETHLDQNTLNIMGSPIHLSKTVMNLVTNATEAMSEGGALTVSTENRYIDRPIRGYDNVKEGDYVVLTIADTGTGIASDDLEKIFEPFYSKKKMGRSGTGLGMAVVWGNGKGS